MATTRILVVDDEEDLCEILKFNLEIEGYDVDTAFSAEEALKKDICSYNLLLLDVMMGEISGFKCYNKSGHLYFSVKDESSAVPCVMFRSSAERLRFAPKDGMSVVLHGSPSLYTRDGKFQFYVI